MPDELITSLILLTATSPLIGWGLIGLAALWDFNGPALRRYSSLVAVAASLFSATGAVILLFATIGGKRVQAGFVWAVFGERQVELSVRLDPLSASLGALVGIIALLVTIYSLGYMREEVRYARYFAYLSFFSGAMLVVVYSGSLLLLYIAWELVGLASYLLIGYYWERPEAGRAATKAFLVTRIGDTGLMLGIAALFLQTGTFDIQSNLAAVASGQINGLSLTVIALLLFAGAAGKSAQLPFQVWLPDAMAGPTPVSALIHSATMVAAGVYLVARMLPLFMASGVAAGVVVVIGILTTLLASSAALFQPELKQVLAYSTISQLGEMMVALGLGGLYPGFLHLVIQGLFKAALFLCAGMLAHALGTAGRVSLETYRGAGRFLPLTRLAFLVAALALAGLPVTLAPSSRDPILSLALAGQPMVAVLLVLADFLTAAYITRAFLLVFTATGLENPASRLPQSMKVRENRVMLGPVLGLVGLLVTVGLIGSPLLGEPFKAFIESGTLTSSETGSNEALAFGLSLLAALSGIGAAYFNVARQPTFASPGLRKGQGGSSTLKALAASGFGFDWFYRLIVVRGALRVMKGSNWIEVRVINPAGDKLAGLQLVLARSAGWFDRQVLDALGDRLAFITLRLSDRQAQFDERVVDRTTEGVARSIGRSSRPLARLQTGQIGNYLLVLFVWGLLALGAGLVLGFLRV